MMKLTVAFLASLAAADAANAHGYRHARRQYGNGYGYGGDYGTNPAAPLPSSTELPIPVESSAEPIPAESTVVPVDEGYPVDLPSTSALPIEPSSSLVPVDEYPAYPTGIEDVSSSAIPIEFPTSGFPTFTFAPSDLPESTAYPEENGPTAYPTQAPSSIPLPEEGSTSEGEIYTSTIYATEVLTVTASSIVSYVTTVVPVATTVCTKGQETSVLPTEVASSIPISETLVTTTETLVYTVGTGSTAHPVTTEIVKTLTSTIYKTVVVTQPVYPEATSDVKPVDVPTGTTTIKTTSTTTKYITVVPTPPAPGGEGDIPVGEEECPVPVTVTVTAQETVTVTAGEDETYETEIPAEYPTVEVPAPSSVAVPTEAAPSSEIPLPTATVIPYPVTNGTSIYPTVPAPTGFVTYTKPYSYGIPAPGPSSSALASEVPSDTLPVFSLLPTSSEPAAYPASTEIPAESTAIPAETSSVPASEPSGGYGGGYGYYRRFFF